jgi:hypothetical protein
MDSGLAMPYQVSNVLVLGPWYAYGVPLKESKLMFWCPPSRLQVAETFGFGATALRQSRKLKERRDENDRSPSHLFVGLGVWDSGSRDMHFGPHLAEDPDPRKAVPGTTMSRQARGLDALFEFVLDL